MKHTQPIVGLLAAFALSHPAIASDDPADTLFESGSILELIIEADFDSLNDDKDQDKSTFRPGEMTVVTTAGPSRKLAVSLKSRGISRLKMGICSFSQLMLRFEDDDLSDTPFAGQQILPLVTQCKKSSRYKQYLLKEYLAYRTYGLLTDINVRTRLAKITYVDLGRKRKELVRHGFFAEHFDQVARRSGREIVSIENFNPLGAEPYNLGLMDVFQYLIGNTDWSVVHQHNVILLQDQSGGIVPMPYDFDWTGLVDASYAYPGAEVNIKSLRQRLYRGACLETGVMGNIFDLFVASKDDIYSLYRGQTEFDAGQLKKTLRYYDEFYETITTPRDREKKILGACRPFQKE
jgi:hypothetical protein